MALSQRIEQVKFTEGAGTPSWTHTIEVQDYGIIIDPLFYTGSPYNEAVSGFLRQNFRGYRPKVQLNWEKSTEGSTIRTLFNDLITSFDTNQDDYIFFYPDAGNADNFKVVLDADNQYRTRYRGQIGRFVPSISLISLYPFNSDNPDGYTTIPAWMEGP